MLSTKIRFGFVRGPYSAYSIGRELDLFQACENLDVNLITPEKIPSNSSCQYRKVRIKKILPDFIADTFFRQPYSPVSFIKIDKLEDHLKDVDIINCVELYSFISSQCANIAKELNKKLVISVWETLPNMPLHYMPPHVWNVETVRKQADLFLAYTKRAAGYLRNLSIPEEKIAVVYPVIDLKKYYPNEKTEKHEIFRILFNSRFAPEKGFDFLFQAFLRLLAEGLDVEMWICGDYRKSVEGSKVYELVQKHKYPIKFLGYLNYDELPNIYKQCDVLCLPSIDRVIMGIKVWEEQFGFVLAEAMACGLIIVASDCGAIPEIVGRRNLIVKQKSALDLYTALRKLVENRSLCREVGEYNRLDAEEMFSVDKQKSNIEKMLKKL